MWRFTRKVKALWDLSLKVVTDSLTPYYEERLATTESLYDKVRRYRQCSIHGLFPFLSYHSQLFYGICFS